jgi:hypothetical protein
MITARKSCDRRNQTALIVTISVLSGSRMVAAADWIFLRMLATLKCCFVPFCVCVELFLCPYL